MIRVKETQLSEEGLTLIEVIVAVAILGIAFVAILAGMGSSIAASVLHRTQANGSVVVVSSAESVKSQEFQRCATPTTYDPEAGVTIPEGWEDPPGPIIEVTEVKYWDGSSFVDDCPVPTDPPEQLQLVTIEVISPDGRDEERISVLKRCEDDSICLPS